MPNLYVFAVSFRQFMNTLTKNPPTADNRSALYTLMTVWFFWSFVAASNGILIPLFKAKFGLSQTQAQYIDFAFYAAYFVGSVIYLLVSASLKLTF